jgi:hypothetical protein
MDGKNFFAADVMRSAFTNATLGNSNSGSDDGSDDPPPAATGAPQRKPQRRQ